MNNYSPSTSQADSAQLVQLVLQLQQQVQTLQQRLDRYDTNGLRMLYFANGFGGSGGLYGTGAQWARIDHSH